MEETNPKRLDLEAFSSKMMLVRQQIGSVVVGQEQTVDLLLTSVLADGHVLLEGVPGVAKTLLARLLARLVDARFTDRRLRQILSYPGEPRAQRGALAAIALVRK